MRRMIFKKNLTRKDMNIPKYLIIHHTGGTDTSPLQDSADFSFAECDALHKQKFGMKSSLGFYVGYHYYIAKDGKVTQARADSDEGAHTVGYNSSSIGICLAGNFDAKDPTPAQVASLRTLLIEKKDRYSILLENIVPHRKFASKTCYGNRLPDSWASLLVMSREKRIEKASALLMEAAALIKGIS